MLDFRAIGRYNYRSMKDFLRIFGMPAPLPTDEDVGRAIEAVEPRPGERRRVFDERTTMRLMATQALNRNAPCKEPVRRVQLEHGKSVSSSTAGYCKARLRVREEAIKAVSDRLASEADRICAPDGAGQILAIDAVTFQADDSGENRAVWPYASGQKPGCGFPVVSALVSHSLVGGGSELLTTGPWKAHDFRLFVASADSFATGDIVIGDRAFCSYPAFALLHGVAAHGIFRSGHFKMRDLPENVEIEPGDVLTTWKKRWSRHSLVVSEERRRDFPDEIQVRVITATIRVRGFRDETITIVTDLLDAKTYPRSLILEWYLRRWEIEVSFRDLKTTLRYEFIRGRKPETVRREILILILAYNLVRHTIARSSPGEWKPRVSIAGTASAVLLWMSLASYAAAHGFISQMPPIEGLLHAVATDIVPKRDRPNNIRAVKRRPKKCRLLMKPRHEYLPEECV